LDFGEAFADFGVAGFEDDAEDDGDFALVLTGENEFESALFEEMEGGGREMGLAEGGLVDGGGDLVGGSGIIERGLVEGEALEVPAELPDADVEAEAFRRRQSDFGGDFFVGEGGVPLDQDSFLVRREGGQGADGAGFSHKSGVLGYWFLFSGQVELLPTRGLFRRGAFQAVGFRVVFAQRARRSLGQAGASVPNQWEKDLFR
jgi:hypothetical protein